MNNLLFETASKRQRGSYAMVMHNAFSSFVVEDSASNKSMSDESSTNRALTTAVKNPTCGTFIYSVSYNDFIDNLNDPKKIPTKVSTIQSLNIFKNSIFPIINLNDKTFELNANIQINSNKKTQVIIKIKWKLLQPETFYNDDRNDSGLHLVAGYSPDFSIEGDIFHDLLNLPMSFNNNFAFFDTESLTIIKFGGIPLSRNNKNYEHYNTDDELDFRDNIGQFFYFTGKISARDSPTICTNTSFRYLFCNSTDTAKIDNIKNWDTSNVTTMAFAFAYSKWNYTGILSWKTFNCRSFSYMFLHAENFNGDISNWNTSNVFYMRYMFAGATSFNCDISHWDVSSVTNMSFMFAGATSFNCDITKWNTSNVENMKMMFLYNSTFNQDISGWDTSSVTDMSGMFKNASAFNQDISKWDTSSVSDMSSMFENAVAFDKYPGIANWNFSNITPYTYTDSNEGLSAYWGLYNFIYNVGTNNQNPSTNFSTFIQNLSINISLPYNIDLGYTGSENNIDNEDNDGNAALNKLNTKKAIQHVTLKQENIPSTEDRGKTLNGEDNFTPTFSFDKPKVLAKKYKQLQ